MALVSISATVARCSPGTIYLLNQQLVFVDEEVKFELSKLGNRSFYSNRMTTRLKVHVKLLETIYIESRDRCM